jgi:hypothetical protein
MTGREIARVFMVVNDRQGRRIPGLLQAINRPYDRRSGKRWRVLRTMKRATRKGAER